jgi:hypothetical protein
MRPDEMCTLTSEIIRMRERRELEEATASDCTAKIPIAGGRMEQKMETDSSPTPNLRQESEAVENVIEANGDTVTSINLKRKLEQKRAGGKTTPFKRAKSAKEIEARPEALNHSASANDAETENVKSSSNRNEAKLSSYEANQMEAEPTGDPMKEKQTSSSAKPKSVAESPKENETNNGKESNSGSESGGASPKAKETNKAKESKSNWDKANTMKAKSKSTRDSAKEKKTESAKEMKPRSSSNEKKTKSGKELKKNNVKAKSAGEWHSKTIKGEILRIGHEGNPSAMSGKAKPASAVAQAGVSAAGPALVVPDGVDPFDVYWTGTSDTLPLPDADRNVGRTTITDRKDAQTTAKDGKMESATVGEPTIKPTIADRKTEQTTPASQPDQRVRTCIMRLRCHEQKCKDCGASDTSILQNDHTEDNKARTADGLRVRAMRDVPLLKIGYEFKKTDIVCPNCHEIRTQGRKSTPPKEATTFLRNQVNLEKAKRGKCEMCPRSDIVECPSMFCFVHKLEVPKENIDSVADMVQYLRPWSDVLEKIHKCRLLCKNCLAKFMASSSACRLELKDFSTAEKALANTYIYGTPQEILAAGQKVPVAQISNGEVIAVFASASEAARATTILRFGIAKCLRGEAEYFDNFSWKAPSSDRLEILYYELVATQPLPAGLLEDYENKQVVKVDPTKNRRSLLKEIMRIISGRTTWTVTMTKILLGYLTTTGRDQIMFTPEIVNAFPSLDAAARSVGGDCASIAACMHFENQTFRGFLWDELDDDRRSLVQGFTDA